MQAVNSELLLAAEKSVVHIRVFIRNIRLANCFCNRYGQQVVMFVTIQKLFFMQTSNLFVPSFSRKMRSINSILIIKFITKEKNALTKKLIAVKLNRSCCIYVFRRNEGVQIVHSRENNVFINLKFHLEFLFV